MSLHIQPPGRVPLFKRSRQVVISSLVEFRSLRRLMMMTMLVEPPSPISRTLACADPTYGSLRRAGYPCASSRGPGLRDPAPSQLAASRASAARCAYKMNSDASRLRDDPRA